MPLALQAPRAGKTPNYYVRGTYYGIVVERTTGTPDRKKATQFLNRIKSEIERGIYTPKGAVTFADAALSYVRNGGERLFLKPIVDHFRERPLMDIDQAAIDAAAALLYPDATNATRNRQVYTPVSAILKHSGASAPLKRPKGAEGRRRTEWMTPEQAERLLDAAVIEDAEFRTFLATLLYTGLRLSEALNIACEDVHAADALIFIHHTKNDEPRAVFIPETLAAELAEHPRGIDRGRETLFRFRKNGHLYNLLKAAKRTAGLPKITFHTFRHTWGTWMRRYAGLDAKGLVDTGAWKDQKSAARYSHSVVTEEAQRAAMLPALKRVGRGNTGD